VYRVINSFKLRAYKHWEQQHER